MLQDLCSTCLAVFQSPLHLNEEQPHHRTPDDFVQAAQTCYICRTITKSDLWVELQRRVALSENVPPATWFLVSHTFKHADRDEVWYKLTIDHDWGDQDGEQYPPPNDESEDLPDFYPETPIWEFRVFSSDRKPIPDIHSSSSELRLTSTTDIIGDQKLLPSSLEDERMLDLPKLWYDRCRQEHPRCAPPDPSFRPTRLIEIVDQEYVRLIETKEKEVSESYVAFSHCWGKAKTLKLLNENKSQLQSRIHNNELPTSYNEALLVCRSMGFRYIWIDSLCIIQNSFDDWQQEALTMKDVYRNSELNLCASAAAENSEASFMTRDITLILPCEISPSWAEPELTTKSWYIAKFDMYDEEVENSPLISRAWVVQEHFLSHRSLHMTKTQLWWGCRQQVACETFPAGYPKASMDPTFEQAMEELKSSVSLAAYKKQQDLRWYKLVEDYARCGLTVVTDKLIAFAGVAQTFTNIFLDDQYLAGMWRSQLPLSLCWSVVHHSHTYRPRDYIAPSWSWASVKGVMQIPLIYDRICFDDGEMLEPINIHCTVLDVRVDLKDPRYQTGQVVSGQLDLHAHMIGPIDFDAIGDDGIRFMTKSPNATNHRVSFQEGGELNFDETTRDGTVRIAWLDGRNIEEKPDDESEVDSPPSFLVPIAEFSAERCDNPHPPATFGIVVCRVVVGDELKLYRVGSFEHLVIPPDLLKAFPRENITID